MNVLNCTDCQIKMKLPNYWLLIFGKIYEYKNWLSASLYECIKDLCQHLKKIVYIFKKSRKLRIVLDLPTLNILYYFFMLIVISYIIKGWDRICQSYHDLQRKIQKLIILINKNKMSCYPSNPTLPKGRVIPTVIQRSWSWAFFNRTFVRYLSILIEAGITFQSKLINVVQ